MKKILLLFALSLMIVLSANVFAGVTRGVNAGFLWVRPTTDPAGASNLTADTKAYVTWDTSPANCSHITEIGWYAIQATEESMTQVGLYIQNGSYPGDLKFSSGDFAKGTTAGWKYKSVDVNITNASLYYLAMQLDDTATTTQIPIGASGGGTRYHWYDSQTSLLNPAPAVSGTGTRPAAIYAICDIPASPPANTCTYSGSGNWAITCSDNCTFSSATTIPTGVNITTTGTGFLSFNNNGRWSFGGVNNYINLNTGCQLNVNSGGGFF